MLGSGEDLLSVRLAKHLMQSRVVYCTCHVSVVLTQQRAIMQQPGRPRHQQQPLRKRARTGSSAAEHGSRAADTSSSFLLPVPHPHQQPRAGPADAAAATPVTYTQPKEIGILSRDRQLQWHVGSAREL
eukprot:g68420.t1